MGKDCHDARPIVVSWTITIMENNRHPIALKLDLVRGESPFIVGLDVMQSAYIINREITRLVKIKRPSDIKILSLFTYITQDEQHRATRLRIEIVQFTHCDARGTRYILLNMADRGTGRSKIRTEPNKTCAR